MQTADSRSTRSGTFNPRAWVTCPAATNHSRIFGRMIVPAYNCNPKNRRRSGCCGLLYGTPTFSALAPSYHAVVATQSWSEHGFESSEMSCLRTKTPQVLICHSRFFFFFDIICGGSDVSQYGAPREWPGHPDRLQSTSPCDMGNSTIASACPSVDDLRRGKRKGPCHITYTFQDSR